MILFNNAWNFLFILNREISSILLFVNPIHRPPKRVRYDYGKIKNNIMTSSQSSGSGEPNRLDLEGRVALINDRDSQD